MNNFAAPLLLWYPNVARDLPWRDTVNPYLIWLSEIILQQTRVAQGLPYYHAFTSSFPTINDLHNAPEEEVLRLWQGLGYYSRARNLKKCAAVIINDFEGNFPRSYGDLLKLPGVGPYTAAAITSFAFKQVVPTVDGNVFRVLARHFEIDRDMAKAPTFKYFFELSESLIDQKQPDTYNQAMMELGATVCTPKNPVCPICPLALTCLAKATGRQLAFPVKSKTIKVKDKQIHYAVFESGEKLLVNERDQKGIWQGLYDFHTVSDTVVPYNAANQVSETLPAIIAGLPGELIASYGPFKHVLSHQRLHVFFHHLKLPLEVFDSTAIKYDLKAAERSEIERLPKPILIANFLKTVDF